MNKNWHKYSEELPPIGIEVIAYNHKWVNEDFNPNGTRVGFRTSDGDFTSAYWWDYQDDYIAISRNRCESSPEFFKNHLDRIEPEWWRPIPSFDK